jgi:hypothetical protein
MEPYLRVSLTYGKKSVIAKRFLFHMGPVYSYIWMGSDWACTGSYSWPHCGLCMSMERGHDRPIMLPHMRPIFGPIWVTMKHPSGPHVSRHCAHLGPVWPIIGTTQGVALEAAVCAYHTHL